MNADAPMTKQAISFRAVSKAFNSVPVLRSVSVDIPLRGITFVVGKSGSGKSVLCRLALGLIQPDAGSIAVSEQRVDGQPEAVLQKIRARVPFVVQAHGLLDWLSVRQNVALVNSQGVDDALAALGLGDFGGKKPPELSPGIRKRAAIARALVLQPEAMVLDEPTTGLNRRAAQQVNDAFSALKARGVGVVAISHDRDALASVADHVIEVADGTITYAGPAGNWG